MAAGSAPARPVRAGLAGCPQRRTEGAGGRFQLLRQQVQPCHPGPPPAGFELQALHLRRAFDKGYNPASIVLDAPVVFRDRRGKTWAPQNDGGGFAARCACAKRWCSRATWSRCVCSMVAWAWIISEFGFAESEPPPNLSMSLGTASLTPLSVARVTPCSPTAARAWTPG